MNRFLSEILKFIIAVPPKDITGAAQNGAWVSMRYHKRLTILIVQGAWAGGTPAVTLQQATSAAGGSAKTLELDTYQQFDQDTGEALARTTVVSNTFNLPAATNVVTVIEIRQGDLDKDNDFAYVRCQVASPGANADLMTMIYLLDEPNYAGKPSTLPAVLT